MKKRALIVVFLAFFAITLLSNSISYASGNIYNDFINGSKSLGFEPNSKFNNEIFQAIKSKYPKEVSNATLFKGAKKELRLLVEAYKADTAGIDSITPNEEILNEFLKKYKGKIPKNLSVFACANGMVNSLNDPESEIILPSVSDNPRRDMIPENYGGLGILIEERKSKVVVVHIFKGSPCENKLKTGDKIEMINGKPVSGLDLDTVLSKLRGPVGSKVVLHVKRNKEDLNIKLVRDKITHNSVAAGILKGDVGYIKIVYFGDRFPGEVYDAVNRFKAKGIKKWILDLRDNAGGALNNMIIMMSLFTPETQPVMIIKYKDREKKFQSVGRKNIPGPAAVIVNNYTTGSAETFAANLREYNKAKIFGKTTRGNTSVAELIKLTGGATLKLTIGVMQSGKGTQINRAGIAPDMPIQGADDPANEMPVIEKTLENI